MTCEEGLDFQKTSSSTTAMHRKFVEKSVFAGEHSDSSYAQKKVEMLQNFYGGSFVRRLRNRKRGVVRLGGKSGCTSLIGQKTDA